MAGTTASIAIYAGSFDPPGANHRKIAELLTERFDTVVIMPHGPRDGRQGEDSLPIHRSVMVDLNFRNLPRVRVELRDLEQGRFTPHCDYQRLFGDSDTEIVHVVSANDIRGGQYGKSRIQQSWPQGQHLWDHARFLVLQEPRQPVDLADLPRHADRMEVPLMVDSHTIRTFLFDDNHAAVSGLLFPEVASYIRRHGLFRPTPPARECLIQIPEPRLRMFYDPRNADSVRIVEKLSAYEHSDPNMILVVGGDGTMLRAIRKHWRERLPFYGLNTGHHGFLLNDKSRTDFCQHDLRLYQLPLLWVEMISQDGHHRGELCFNDCWLERETGQTAWVEVAVNGQVRMPKVVADGMLVATAAGSTSYARAMGATPIPFNAPLLTLAGSNVLKPEFWHPAILTTDSIVRFRNLDPNKRPLRGFIDGVSQGQVIEMTARVSNIAAVELLFAREHDPVAKLALLQFPQLAE